jgi:thiol-disulfide isomerase/thioredoxin
MRTIREFVTGLEDSAVKLASAVVVGGTLLGCAAAPNEQTKAKTAAELQEARRKFDAENWRIMDGIVAAQKAQADKALNGGQVGEVMQPTSAAEEKGTETWDVMRIGSGGIEDAMRDAIEANPGKHQFEFILPGTGKFKVYITHEKNGEQKCTLQVLAASPLTADKATRYVRILQENVGIHSDKSGDIFEVTKKEYDGDNEMYTFQYQDMNGFIWLGKLRAPITTDRDARNTLFMQNAKLYRKDDFGKLVPVTSFVQLPCDPEGDIGIPAKAAPAVDVGKKAPVVQAAPLASGTAEVAPIVSVAKGPSMLELSDKTFNAEVAKGELLIVDFVHEDCEYCVPTIEALDAYVKSQNGKIKLARVDARLNPELLKRFEIDRFPAVIFFYKGKYESSLAGVLDGNTIKKDISRIVDEKVKEIRKKHEEKK